MALPTQTPYNPRRFSNHPSFMLKAALMVTLCSALATCMPTLPAWNSSGVAQQIHPLDQQGIQ